ncbi:MAG: family 20 glycosylhydrolase, partial [Planctomycetota bacterium]
MIHDVIRTLGKAVRMQRIVAVSTLSRPACRLLGVSCLMAGPAVGWASARNASPIAFSAPQIEFSPAVKSVTWSSDRLDLKSGAIVCFDERRAAAGREDQRSLEAHARVVAAELGLLTARPFEVAPLAQETPSDRPRIELVFMTPKEGLVASEEDETHGYRLEVNGQRVVVSGAYTKSIACGTSTLLQAVVQGPDGPGVPGMTVEDAPSAAFRSIMIDVARNAHSIDVLEDVIRLARQSRMRYVHLHLTDDQLFTFPFARVVDRLEGNVFHSREDLTGLVAYAEARGITLIPEIDLPGHSRRLRESGYLKGAENDRDVADERFAAEMAALLGDVMDVFDSSPYFHIGGDESGAGDQLLPFLARVQALVRDRGKRLIVWEGFHGAPTEILPATGEDRVIVAAWESSYNAPWDLLKAGYTLINASWRPTYVVGGDSLVHPGSSAGRKWAPEEIAIWHKDRFMHWEPGRPVFEDRGPLDANRNDGIWDVPEEEWRDRILGGQMCVWEQKESSVIRDLRWRLPVLADRLWSGPDAAPEDVLRRARAVDARVFGLVQPVELRLANAIEGSRIDLLFAAYDGEHALVEFTPRLPGVSDLRCVHAAYSATFGWIDFPGLPSGPDGMKTPDLEADSSRAKYSGGGAIAARAFAADGSALPGTTWLRYLPWPARVRVTEYDIGRRPLDSVPDLGELPEAAKGATFTMPSLRGPLDHARVKAQRHEATLVVDKAGSYMLGAKTQSV